MECHYVEDNNKTTCSHFIVGALVFLSILFLADCIRECCSYCKWYGGCRSLFHCGAFFEKETKLSSFTVPNQLSFKACIIIIIITTFFWKVWISSMCPAYLKSNQNASHLACWYQYTFRLFVFTLTRDFFTAWLLFSFFFTSSISARLRIQKQ